jgi:hypothetical protein
MFPRLIASHAWLTVPAWGRPESERSGVAGVVFFFFFTVPVHFGEAIRFVGEVALMAGAFVHHHQDLLAPWEFLAVVVMAKRRRPNLADQTGERPPGASGRGDRLALW